MDPGGLIGVFIGLVIFGAYFRFLTRSNSLPFALWISTVFVVLPLSHLYHTVWDEQTLSSVCSTYEGWRDLASCAISLDIRSDQVSAYILFDSWEATVALEVLVFKLLQAATILATRSRWDDLFSPFSDRNISFAIVIILVIDGVIGFVLFADPTSNFKLLTWFGLAIGTLVAAGALFAYGGRR